SMSHASHTYHRYRSVLVNLRAIYYRQAPSDSQYVEFIKDGMVERTTLRWCVCMDARFRRF
uniref:GH18 domain-containing protein n=1 Tax=Parascaris univalens TaxID=6257 RepID=A0A914ZSF7_PARUN